MSGKAGGTRSRVQLFIGKGGVGKTTLACATALSRARAGERVLLASIDQAHSIGDALGVKLSHDPGTTAGFRSVAPGLDVIEIDTLALLEERYREVVKTVSLGDGHNHGAELTALDPAELTGLPGAQELLGLAEIAEYAIEDSWDTIVVDCGATADTLRTLASPEMFLGYLERVWPQHKRVSAAIGTDIRLIVLVSAVEKVVAAVSAVRDLFSDRDKTSARLVTIAEHVAIAETARARSAAALLGLRLEAVVVNKVLPPLEPPGVQMPDGDHPAVHWYRSRRREQLDVIAELEQSMGEVGILTAQHTGPEPVGLSSLGALAYAVNADIADVAPDRAGPAPNVTVRLESGTGLDSLYIMRIHLPVVDPSSLSLGRAEDDLIVGADGIRRRLPLASVLRRCTVSGAELDGSALLVHFRPDPKVWPR